MQIREIEKYEAVKFVRKYHYSNIMPRLTKYYLGFYENETLIGVVTLGWGTQPLHTIRKIFYEHEFDSKDYLEIGKMCFLPSNNRDKSTGSQIVSALIKWIKENTEAQFLYTMADGIMGKVGYVYQASNFTYIGKFKTSVYYDTITGEKIHPRSAKKILQENQKFSNKSKLFWLTEDFCKHKGIEKINGYMFRYILPLNKKARRVIEHYQYKEKNPKDDSLMFERRIDTGIYEAIEMPNFNMNVSKYNHQKWEYELIDMFEVMKDNENEHKNA